MSVSIYLLEKGWALWLWLCDACLAQSKAEGWTVKEKRTVPHALTCDGAACKVRQQKEQHHGPA